MPEPTQPSVPKTVPEEKFPWPWIGIGTLIALTCAAAIIATVKKKQKEAA